MQKRIVFSQNLGAKNKKQAEQNAEAAGWFLSKKESALISAAEKQTH
ncbi:MAG: hypothetical protein ABF651_05120 [Sporolactobacillus sp.]